MKWVFGSIITKKKASGGDGIPAELFQILNDDAFCCNGEKNKILRNIST